mgnify:FL=1
MAKKRSTETAENAAVNQESKEPKKKQEDILLEMIQRYHLPVCQHQRHERLR